jgi:hypothetical protein
VRRVLLALSMQEGWGNVGWASDWGKNIYAPSAFLGAQGSEPKTFNVRTQFTAPDGNEVDKTWKVGVFITQARRLAHALRLRRTGGGGTWMGHQTGAKTSTHPLPSWVLSPRHTVCAPS